MEAYYAEIQNEELKNIHYLVGNTWDEIISDTYSDIEYFLIQSRNYTKVSHLLHLF